MIVDKEPWHEKVDLNAALNEAVALMYLYTVITKEGIHAIVLWCAYTWFHEYGTVSPILNLFSPEKRCGKSTVLNVIKRFCKRSIVASNISPPALYRTVEKLKPTLLVDEADTFLAKNEELRGILNAGHYRDTAFVYKCVGDDNNPTSFNTFCPKVIAGIGKPPETIEDRSISVEMKRKLTTQKVQSIRRANNSQFDEIAQKFARYAQDNSDVFSAHLPNGVEQINDRANDNWEPLFTIADLAGGEWPQLAREAAIALSGTEEETSSIGEQLLSDCYEILAKNSSDRIRTVDLLDSLCADDEKPWLTWNRGERITNRQLRDILVPFGIKPTDIKFDSKTKRGYYKADFTDAYQRYVAQSDTTGTTDTTAVEVEINPLPLQPGKAPF